MSISCRYPFPVSPESGRWSTFSFSRTCRTGSNRSLRALVLFCVRSLSSWIRLPDYSCGSIFLSVVLRLLRWALHRPERVWHWQSDFRSLLWRFWWHIRWKRKRAFLRFSVRRAYILRQYWWQYPFLSCLDNRQRYTLVVHEWLNQLQPPLFAAQKHLKLQIRLRAVLLFCYIVVS